MRLDTFLRKIKFEDVEELVYLGVIRRKDEGRRTEGGYATRSNENVFGMYNDPAIYMVVITR